MMMLCSPLETLPSAIAAACHRDLSDIQEPSLDWHAMGVLEPGRSVPLKKQIRRRPGKLDVLVMMFPQNWDTPSLGYPGIHQPPRVLAYTVVVCTKTEACVYFGSDCLAYRVVFNKASAAQADAWAQDCANRTLVHQDLAAQRYGATSE